MEDRRVRFIVLCRGPHVGEMMNGWEGPTIARLPIEWTDAVGVPRIRARHEDMSECINERKAVVGTLAEALVLRQHWLEYNERTGADCTYTIAEVVERHDLDIV